ncbi:PglZ domain-containing protein [Candidatus Viadribacter manganicus]|uniref:Uncharacterized protein n=1 Tax=Candidatus Viadribacter manganicus TaxID=1759059 RepID=A0A1B1AHR4_9PROT|nr:PglZ domain-containing protein [Candidatus Viadribacter manganicus]ANP46080.1 hypothetical protein ATE48_09175 [Candidatus Viadribacter manganicus]
MMHPLHEHIGRLIGEQVRERKIVVIYDEKRQLTSFFDELVEGRTGDLIDVTVGAARPKLHVCDGSFLKTRFAVEELVAGPIAPELLIYLPGMRHEPKMSLLAELEKAGKLYAPQPLKLMTRHVLKQRFHETAIDDMLRSDALTYADYARLAQIDANGGGGSLLKSVFRETDTASILTVWLASDEQDTEIEAKGATGELRGLLEAKLGIASPAEAPSRRLRAIVGRFVLANEFRSDLAPGACLTPDAAQALGEIPTAAGDQEHLVREIAKRLRERHAENYVKMAEQVAGDLGFSEESVSGAHLGAVDTFAFEERAVSVECFERIAKGQFAAARAIIKTRQRSFWIERNVERVQVWQICQRMIEVGEAAEATVSTIARGNGNPRKWVERYTADQDGWFTLDHAQRKLETILHLVDDHIDERAKAKVRAVYDDAVQRMNVGFANALESTDWTVPEVLHQTRIWPEIVASRPTPVAVFAVDAMRYEMGRELLARMKGVEGTIRPAIAALPSITPIGMAALLPGASASFSIANRGAKFGATVEGVFLPDLTARQRYLKTHRPDLVDITLDEVIQLGAKRLKGKVEGASLVFVRSTEIDAAGEGNSLYARRVMENVVEDLARAIRRLGDAGVEQFVVTADHGFLHFAEDLPESMRCDAPGGQTADLHRRCWIGRGGTTPPGSIRIPGARLGYATDLDVVVPRGAAVFRSGGDLAYHHGGASLQELVIPVLTFRLTGSAEVKLEKNVVTVSHEDAVTNRIFVVKISLGGGGTANMFEEQRAVRPIALFENKPGAVVMAVVGADAEGGRVLLKPKTEATVAFRLTNEDAENLQIQVLDADSDAVLYSSSKPLPVRLGV